MRQGNLNSAKMRKQGFGWLKSLALVPVPILIALIIYFAYTDPAAVIEPPYLLLALNTLFTTIIPFTVAYLAWRSYANSGQWRLFLIGCGMVAFGFGSLVAGVVINVPDGVNLAVTVYNTGALLAAILISTAAIFSMTKSTQAKLERNHAIDLGLYYLFIIIFMSLFTITVYQGLIPHFFVQGTGTTVLRQLVLGTAIALFAVASVIFLRVYFRSHADFTYWLSMALILIVVGLGTVFFQRSVGGPGGWTGRAAQYLGCVYLLAGIVSAYRISNIKRIPLEKEFARSFDYIEANYKTLVEMAPNAIISCDKQSRILSWNPAAAKIFGYTEPEAIGADVIDFIFPRESALLINSELQELARAKGQPAEFSKKLETTARRKQGEDFPVEVYMAVKVFSGEWMGTFIIRDITERKQTEDSLQKSENKMSGVFRAAPIGIGMVLNRVFVDVNDKFCEMLGYSRSELINQSARMIYLSEDDFNFVGKEKYAQITERGFGSVETRFKRKNGTVINIILSSTQADTSDLAKGVIFTAQDITERKLAEQRILSQSAVLKSINRVFEETLRCDTDVEVASVCLSVAQELSGSKFGWVGEVNADGNLDTIALSDPGWESCRMPQSQATKMIRDMQVRGIWGRVLKAGKSLITNDPAGHPDSVGLPKGHPALIAFMGVPLKHAGQTIGMIALANKPGGYDIHDQEAIEALSVAFEEALRSKRADEAILRSKLLLQSVIDSTPDWMYVKDFQHKFLLVNKSLAEAQNLTPQEMIGMADTELFPEELCLGNPDKGIAGYHAEDDQAFQGQVVHNPRNFISWADGSMHSYDTYKIPLTDQSGKIYAALVYSRDITERQKAEDERETALTTVRETMTSLISTMSRIVEMRDPYTAGHQQRVADLSGAIARAMNLDDFRIEHLVIAAKVHDIGKMYVPSDILSKPGRLSDIEFSLIKTHAQGGYDILRDIKFSKPVALMALQHHERLDGSGYPNGLKDDEILMEAKILAVADVVEAMISHRPYRPALGIDKALEEIYINRGVLYDPDAVDICVKLFREQGFKFGG